MLELNYREVARYISHSRVVHRQHHAMQLAVFINQQHNLSGMPYDKWGVVGIANRLELKMVRALDFQTEDYPGYSHRRTAGFRPGVSGEENEDITYKKCKTFIFERKEYYLQRMKELEREKNKTKKKRKRKGGDSSQKKKKANKRQH